jgi:uncharacterized protein
MELSPIRGQATSPTKRLVQFMRQHPLLCYFLIALGFTWVYELIVYGLLHLPYLSIVGRLFILGPTLAAFIMMAITEGRAGVLRLLRSYVLWRVGIPWYLFILLGIPALVLLGDFVLPGAVAAFRAPAPTFALSYVELFVVIFFGVALFEEPGWRGFALPRLQQHAGPLVGTLLLGVLWALWHLPLFLFVPANVGAGTGFVGILVPYVAFIVSTLALAVIFTWLFNNARGSLLLVMLLHTSYDTAYGTILSKLFPSLPTTLLSNFLGDLNIVLIGLAVLIIAATRGGLSYQRYQREMARPSPVTDGGQEQGGTASVSL